MACLTLSAVSRSCGGFALAVDAVSIDIKDGEFIVLVEPSDCGKSTLLRMVAGLETIIASEVKIGERAVNLVDPADCDIAMVFRNQALYPHMTMSENLAYALKNRRLPKVEIAVTESQSVGLG